MVGALEVDEDLPECALGLSVGDLEVEASWRRVEFCV
jgi:hypothetical protein